MCGRFTYKYTWKQIHDLLTLTFMPEAERASFNVAPTQQAPVVRQRDDGRELVFLRWGLVPSWAKDEKIGNTLINARSETAPTKPAFRAAFAKRRCIVPVSGFYEWQKLGAKGKQPWYIERADGRPLLLAGLWESWTPEGGTPLETFTILTTAPNAAMAALHDRMPAVLEPEQAQVWLNPATDKEAAAALLGPAADGVLAMHPVSTRVNSPRNDTANLIEPVAAPTPPPGADAPTRSRAQGLFDPR